MSDKKEKTKKTTVYLVMTALFTAMVFVATFLLRIPAFSGSGYINFGDAIIFIAGMLLGPVGAGIAGGLGSCFADLIGFPFYAPFTLIIKGLEGVLCGYFFHLFRKMKRMTLRKLLSFLIASAVVIIGYFLTDFLLVFIGQIASESKTFTAALLVGIVSIPGTLLQVGVSIAVALLVSIKMPSFMFFELPPKEEEDEKDDG